MNDLPRLAGRIFNRPLMVEPLELDAMMAPLRARLGVQGNAPSVELVVAPRAMDQEDEAAARRDRRPYLVTAEGVAIVPVLGVLVARAGQVTPDCTELRSYAAIERDVMMALRDPGVRGIVYDGDTPGGEAANVMELSARLRALRGTKPIIAVANTGAYSAGYALLSAADRILLPPSGGVGSIGVVSLHVDRSEEDARKGHRYTWIAAGARKLDGNPHAPLTDDAAAVIQAEVTRLYGLFTETVAANRKAAGMTVAKAVKTEAGLFFGEDAIRAGLADEIGGLAEAIRLAAAPLQSGRGRPSARSQHAGGTMADDNQADSPANPPANPAPQGAAAAPPAGPDVAAIQAAANAAAQARAAGIAALCELAGVPHQAAAFIGSNKTEADVRTELLAVKAAASTVGGEVSAARPPGAGVIAQQPGGPQVMTAEQVDAHWNRVGKRAFGNSWKGI
ncbi:S49 family peptidase [Roseomonas sp. HJA6]|uniref:S49 family peptidase n=1 Tax=Roseomonas alba TaxID=2846776 RepID=A0ABS7ACF2_9PROT|nr:S49 family peptidase [Neoroseomonas alba]MBW6399989.1 S49 family peptidase [Neoroseomonas alba]